MLDKTNVIFISFRVSKVWVQSWWLKKIKIKSEQKYFEATDRSEKLRLGLQFSRKRPKYKMTVHKDWTTWTTIFISHSLPLPGQSRNPVWDWMCVSVHWDNPVSRTAGFLFPYHCCRYVCVGGDIVNKIKRGWGEGEVCSLCLNVHYMTRTRPGSLCFTVTVFICDESKWWNN